MTYSDDASARADRRRLLLERIDALQRGDQAAADRAREEFKREHVDARSPAFRADLANARRHAPITGPAGRRTEEPGR